LLVVCVLVQVILMRDAAWFPDIILIMVVFTGIFRGGTEALALGIVAGLLRGSFSVGTLPLDILIFPLVGVMSAALARMFYRQNPAIQVLITSAALAAVVAAHTLYLNVVSGNDVALSFVFMNSLWTLALTVILSPLIFLMLRPLWSEN